MIEPNMLIFPRPFHLNAFEQLQKIDQKLIYISKTNNINNTNTNNNYIQNINYVSQQVLSRRMSLVENTQLMNIQKNTFTRQTQILKQNKIIDNKYIQFSRLNFNRHNKQNRKIISQQNTARDSTIYYENINENIQQQKTCKYSCLGLNQNINKNNNIPSLLIRYDKSNASSKIGLYYHANAEDIIKCYQFIKKLSERTRMDILIVQYPGYSIYESDQVSSDRINKDIPFIMRYLSIKLNYSYQNILVIGRSIGTCFALYIGKHYPISGLLLISPFTTFKQVVKNLYGQFASILSKEIFNNLQQCQAIQCPVLIVHGLQDRVIHYGHSIQLSMSIKSYCELKLVANMTHNKFNYERDLFVYLGQFLCQIGFNQQ